MEKTVKERLIDFIRYKGMSQKKFEESVNLSNGYIFGLKHSPSVSKLSKIFDVYPDLNRVWLLTGEGQMINSSDVSPAIEQERKLYTENTHGVKFYEQEDGRLLMEVPVIPFDALGAPPDDYTELVASRGDDERTLFPVECVKHGKYFAFKVDNDSMDDGSRSSFRKGDTVLVRELDRQDWQPRLYINKWRFWVVAFGNCIRIKEIIGQDPDTGTLTLHSLNPSPEYTDFQLPLSQVARLFNVIQVRPAPIIFGDFDDFSVDT